MPIVDPFVPANEVRPQGHAPLHDSIGRTPPKALQRTTNSSLGLTLVAVWRHIVARGSGPVSAVAGR